MIPVALKFENGELHLLDQRVLPAREEWVTCRDAADAARGIADLVVRGAPAIGIAAAYGMALAAGAKGNDAVAEAAGMLIAARPTAVNLAWAVRCMQDRYEQARSNLEDVPAVLLEEARRIHREDALACRAIGRHGRTLLSDAPRILTHCNAGALATGGIGTALAPVYTAHEEGCSAHVFACEARPVMQGARLTTWELRQAGVPVTLLVDAAAAYLIGHGDIESIWVGADRIAANGDVANKIGTYGLACAAGRAGVPFYVAAPRSTFDADTPEGAAIRIEHRDGTELAARFSEQVSASGIEFWTPAFDVTPAELITAYVSEEGVTPGGRSK